MLLVVEGSQSARAACVHQIDARRVRISVDVEERPREFVLHANLAHLAIILQIVEAYHLASVRPLARRPQWMLNVVTAYVLCLSSLARFQLLDLSKRGTKL